jgi:DNA-binding winged helix-turn-helix (wHTH) protein
MEQDIIYMFGPFRLQTATQLLWHKETQIRLTPKVYGLLQYFLLHPGRLISHQELFDSVWSGRIVDDSALRLAINSLRKALHDEKLSPLYVLTVSKRGYRFLAEVTVNPCFRSADAVKSSPLHYRPQEQISHAWLENTQELTALQQAFQQALLGERRMVFLHGEQGKGKTALLDSFLTKVDHPELAVLRARCVQIGNNTEPFLPLLEALARRCREPNGRWLIERLNKSAPSWLYQILNEIYPDETAKLPLKLSHSNFRRMLREGADFFETLSKGSILILILDNSHWSDECTLDLLNFLMFRCSAAKLLIIISYRPCEDESGARRIEQMRAELLHRGLGYELSMTDRLH